MDSSTAAKLVFQWNSPLGDQPGRFFKLTTLPMERAMVPPPAPPPQHALSLFSLHLAFNVSSLPGSRQP